MRSVKRKFNRFWIIFRRKIQFWAIDFTGILHPCDMLCFSHFIWKITHELLMKYWSRPDQNSSWQYPVLLNNQTFFFGQLGFSSVTTFSWMPIVCQYAERNNYFYIVDLILNSTQSKYQKMSARKVNSTTTVNHLSALPRSNSILWVLVQANRLFTQSTSSSYCIDP